jgi:hypothetical protein
MSFDGFCIGEKKNNPAKRKNKRIFFLLEAKARMSFLHTVRPNPHDMYFD